MLRFTTIHQNVYTNGGGVFYTHIGRIWKGDIRATEDKALRLHVYCGANGSGSDNASVEVWHDHKWEMVLTLSPNELDVIRPKDGEQFTVAKFAAVEEPLLRVGCDILSV